MLWCCEVSVDGGATEGAMFLTSTKKLQLKDCPRKSNRINFILVYIIIIITIGKTTIFEP
jgi:hypothetical protein